MRQALDLGWVVADQDDHAPCQHLELDQLLGERGRLGIERGGRLIEQQHARLVGDGADEPQTLALAGRELGNRPVEHGGLQRQRGEQPIELGGAWKVLARDCAPPRRLGGHVAHAASPLRARQLATLQAFEVT